jgi:hypothetical protein
MTDATTPAHLSVDLARRIALTTWLTALFGGLAFALGVVLHPGRTGWEIAAAPQYALVHEVIALGLALQLAALVGLRVLFADRLGRGTWTFWLVFAGQLLWFALIIFDGSHNPVMARLAPEIVHTPADRDGATLLIVVPALLCFPAGHAAWGVTFYRAARLPALPLFLAAVGACVYAYGGISIFILGPASPVISIAEIAGAVLFAFGFGWSAFLVQNQLARRAGTLVSASHATGG